MRCQPVSTVSLNPPDKWDVFDRTRNSRPEWQQKPYIVQADIRLNSAVWSGGVANWLVSVQLRSAMMVRMLQNDSLRGDQSFAVRTPGYLPGLALVLSHQRWWHEERTWAHFVEFKAWHHSNGQDNFEIGPDKWVNTHDGDFAERMNFAVSWYSLSRGDRAGTAWIKAGYDWRPKKWVNGLFTYFDIYAHHRAMFEVGRIYPAQQDASPSPVRCRMSFQSSWMLDRTWYWGSFDNLNKVGPGDWQKRLNMAFTAHYLPWLRLPVGVFAQAGYYGSDPYNVYFQQSLWFYRVGLSWPRS